MTNPAEPPHRDANGHMGPDSPASDPSRTDQTQDTQTPQTIYEQVGGHETFVALTERFYQKVAGDPPLRALYPEEDLAPAAERLQLFLEQFFGGPTTYSQERGHPRLRMRHHPFAVTPTQRDRWLHHMNAAMDSLSLPEPAAGMMRDYFHRSAAAMVNTLEDPEDPLASGGDSTHESATNRPRLRVRRVD